MDWSDVLREGVSFLPPIHDWLKLWRSLTYNVCDWLLLTSHFCLVRLDQSKDRFHSADPCRPQLACESITGVRL